MTQNNDFSQNVPRWEQKLLSYQKALSRLSEIVTESKQRALNDFEKDGLIQRFEFTHESAWKLIKSFAEYQGENEISGSRDASRWAFENHIVTQGEIWMRMIRSRNETSHLYDNDVAEENIKAIQESYLPALVELYERLNNKATHTEKNIFYQE